MNYAPDAVYEQGWRDALADAVQRVEALPFSMLDKHDRLYAVEQVIDAIKEGQEASDEQHHVLQSNPA